MSPVPCSRSCPWSDSSLDSISVTLQRRFRAFHCAGLSYVPVVRYLFADCRWALDDPELGRSQYLAGHIPGAVFLDVERDLSAPPGPAGGIRFPRRSDFARAAGLGRDRARHVRRRLRLDGRRRAALVAAAPLRPRRLRRDRPRRLARPADAGRGDAEPAVFEPRPRDRRHDRARRAGRAPRGARRRRRPPAARAGAASRTRRPRSRAASRARSTRPGPSRCPSYPPASSSPTAARGSPPASPSTASTSPAATGASTRARGPSGSSAPELPRETSGLRRLRAPNAAQVLLPARRDLRRGEPDEEHRRGRARRMRAAPSAPRAAAGCPCAGCRARRR